MSAADFMLTAENYFSAAADYEYMSVSQFKNFVGSYGMPGCYASAMAQIQGRYRRTASKAMLIGSYVDAYFEGTLDQFKDDHPELFKQDGSLRAEFEHANRMIERVEQDEVFMSYMAGEKQVIMTGEIGGVPWKIKIDSYLPGVGIVDLKVMESLTKQRYIADIGDRLDFIRVWGYDIQGAVYHEIVRQNTGQKLPFYIAGISKEDPTNFDVIYVHDVFLQEAIRKVEREIDEVMRVKRGEQEATRCEKCAYCISTKRLARPIGIPELLEAV